MMQQDSIQHADIETLEASSQEASSVRHDGYHSPREIISWLPRTATPWQQDSAIRANYKYFLEMNVVINHVMGLWSSVFVILNFTQVNLL